MEELNKARKSKACCRHFKLPSSPQFLNVCSKLCSFSLISFSSLALLSSSMSAASFALALLFLPQSLNVCSKLCSCSLISSSVPQCLQQALLLLCSCSLISSSMSAASFALALLFLPQFLNVCSKLCSCSLISSSVPQCLQQALLLLSNFFLNVCSKLCSCSLISSSVPQCLQQALLCSLISSSVPQCLQQALLLLTYLFLSSSMSAASFALSLISSSVPQCLQQALLSFSLISCFHYLFYFTCYTEPSLSSAIKYMHRIVVVTYTDVTYCPE